MPCHCHSLSDCFNYICGIDLRDKYYNTRLVGEMKNEGNLVGVLRKILRKNHGENHIQIFRFTF